MQLKLFGRTLGTFGIILIVALVGGVVLLAIPWDKLRKPLIPATHST